MAVRKDQSLRKSQPRKIHRRRNGAGPAGLKAGRNDELWLYGIHAVHAALANPRRTRLRLVATRNAARQLQSTLPGLTPPPELLEPDRIARLLPPGAVHQGLALLTAPLAEPDLETACAPARADAPVVVLDHVTDPHNVGAVLRSAAAFGGRALVMTWRRSPPLTGALAKVAAGALEHVPVVKVQNLARALDDLRTMGYRLIGLDEKAPANLAQTVDAESGPLALVLGAEGEGLRKLTAETCDTLARLPTGGPVSSLNVSNAAAISLYEVRRRGD